jgi:acyl-CoA synthetase (AMP-forming)/AMP-acid ligase II
VFCRRTLVRGLLRQGVASACCEEGMAPPVNAVYEAFAKMSRSPLWCGGLRESVSAEELIAHAEITLADFKVARIIHFETALPLGKTGKVDKTALKQRIAGSSDA